MIHVLTARDYRNMPWKNGQGTTLEIARSHGEGLENFDWRVSIADVKAAGEFSLFPNKQRIIGVFEGAGIILHVDQSPPVTLPLKSFFAFHGESQVDAELINGAIRDFNLIYNPQKYAARLQWFNKCHVTPWVSDASQILVFNAAECLKLKAGTQQCELNTFETLAVEGNQQPLDFNIEQNAHCDFCLIELFRK